jgi:hypothetical protein
MKKRSRALEFFGLVFFVTGLTACVDLSPKYGVVAVQSAQNAELYFKREVRGLNYDVVVLSSNRQFCEKADSKSEFIFSSDPLPMYYNFEGNTLNLFVTSVAAQPPDFQSPVKVVQHNLSPSEFAEMQRSFKDQGLKRLDVPIDEKLRCP